MGLSLVSLLTVCFTIANAGSTPLESVSLHDEGRVDNINVTSKTLEDRSVGCSKWNGKSWLGVTPANPVPTACGLRTCIRCVEVCAQLYEHRNYRGWVESV